MNTSIQRNFQTCFSVPLILFYYFLPRFFYLEKFELFCEFTENKFLENGFSCTRNVAEKFLNKINGFIVTSVIFYLTWIITFDCISINYNLFLVGFILHVAQLVNFPNQFFETWHQINRRTGNKSYSEALSFLIQCIQFIKLVQYSAREIRFPLRIRMSYKSLS